VFLTCVVAGEALWVGLFVGLGYLFSDSWPGILETVQDSVGIVLGLALMAAALGLLLFVGRRGSAASS
jgi:membrane protein DedA with SNARE-associated domain